MKIVICAVALLCAVQQVFCDDSYAKADEALRTTLFDGYNKDSLPDKFTMINITGVTINHIALDEVNHIMTMQSWLKENWYDPRFEWDPSDNAGISYLAVEPDAIWMPDLALYNPDSAKLSLVSSDVKALVYPNGKVLYVPPIDFNFKCLIDLTYWPHDVHNCSLKIGSWVHSALVIDLNVDEFKFEIQSTDTVSPNTDNPKNVSHSDFVITDWNVIRIAKYYDCCTEAYVSIELSMLVARFGEAYNWTIKLPAVCLCILTLVLFLMPPGAGEKVVFGGICLILDFLFLHYISGEVGHAPTHTPLIVKLLGHQIVLVMASTLISAIVVRIANAPHPHSLPSAVRKSISAIAKLLCLGNYTDSQSSQNDEVENGTLKSPVPLKPQSTTESPSEWLMISAVVDRLAFLIYLVICLISLIRFTAVV